MAGLKEIRIRITSVSSTRQITSAMKMVAAAKLRKAQDAVTQIRPYADKLDEILSNLSASLDPNHENVYAQHRDIKRVLIVPITSNRGLCGAFNANVIKKSVTLATEVYSKQYENGNVSFFAVGKKASDMLKLRDLPISGEANDVYDDLSFNNVAETAAKLMHGFVEKDYDQVDFVYNEFKNAATQILRVKQFLPIEIESDDDNRVFKSDYIYEPSVEFIVNVLIPKALKIEFYKAVLDSHASEHGARMTAMHQATDNATELIKELRLHYNKARQAAITTELTEIVGGAEVLRS